jgi:hypothetical protein
MYDFDSFKKEVKPQGGIPSSTPKKKGEYDFDSFTNEVSKKKEPTSLDFWNAGLPSKDGSQVEAPTKSQVTSGAEEENKPSAQDINAIRETVTGETNEQRQLRQQKELKNKAAKILPSKNTVEQEAISRLQHPAIQQQIEQSKRMIGISDLNNDPIGNLINKNELEKKQIKDAGGNSLESIKEIAVRDKQVELVKNDYFSDGYDAEEYLKSHPPDPNSETYKIALQKAKDKHKIDDVINTTTDFGKAANKLYSGEENEMQGDISNSKEGDNVYKLLQDPNVIAKAQHDPEFRTKYKEAQFNFYNHYPAKAKEIVNTKIAQKLEDDNHTGWFYNNPGKEKVDKVVDEMVKTGEINPQEKHIYDNEREDLGTLKSLLMGSPIPTADVVNSYSKNLVEGGKGILSSARDISNKATGGFFKRIGLLESDEDRTKRLQEQQYSTPTVEGKGAHGVLSGMSGFLGFATPMIVGGMAGSPAAATAVMQFEGPNADYARENIKGKGAQTAYTIAATGIDAFLMKLLPTKQAGEAISGLFKKELAGTITDLADHKITQAAAQDLWANKLKNYASSVIKHNTQTAAVVDAFELAHNGLKAAFGSRDFNLENEAKEAIKNYPSLWLNSTFLSGLSALSSSAKSLNGGTIRRLANDPDGARLQIEEMAKKHPELEQFKEQSLENLDHAIKINEELKQRPNLSEKQKDKFMMLSLKDKILNEKASGIPDKTLKTETEKELASNEIEKERILNPKNSNTKFLEEMYDNDLLPAKSIIEVEGKFNENKVGDYLKFIAQQANSLDENWKPIKGKPPEMPSQLVEVANERWAKEIKSSTPKEPIEPKVTVESKSEPTTTIEKPKLEELPFLKTEDFDKARNSSHMAELGSRQKEIKEKFTGLRKMIECLWS